MSGSSGMDNAMREMEDNMRKMKFFVDEQFQKFHPQNFMDDMFDKFYPDMERSKNGFPSQNGLSFPQNGFPKMTMEPMKPLMPPEEFQNHGFFKDTPPLQDYSISGSSFNSGPSLSFNNSHPVSNGHMDNNPELSRYIQRKPDGRKELELQLDMQGFHPEEIKVVKDRNKLEVNAYHEEKEPNMMARKVFQQQYHLPKNVRLARMKSEIDPTGTLTVKSSVKPRQCVKFAQGQDLEQTKLLY